MRSYDIAIASLAIDAPLKWTDNVLAQFQPAGVVSVRRGVARRIERPALILLALTRELHLSLDMTVRAALDLARDLLVAPDSRGVHRGVLRLAVDREALELAVDRRLRDALESAPRPRRGRPPLRGAK